MIIPQRGIIASIKFYAKKDRFIYQIQFLQLNLYIKGYQILINI